MSTGAKLRQKNGDSPGQEILLKSANILGRSATATIVLADPEISQHHAEIFQRGGDWFLTDLQSRNGTWLDGQRLVPNQHTRLQSGNVICMGKTEFVYEPADRPQQNQKHPQNPKPQNLVNMDQNVPDFDLPSQIFELRPCLTVGRDPSCDIVLNFPNVSRRHCQIVQGAQGYYIEDLKSRTGTYLNGMRIAQRERLKSGAEVRIGLTQFIFRDGKLEQFEQTGVVWIDAAGLFQVVQKSGKPMTLLNDVNFVIQPREFVAVVGASGAGKSTLLNAMTGLRPASTGSILINGVDFYTHMELFRTAIGYVPQREIVHHELTVAGVLRYAARLRLPPDTSPAEIEKLVDGALRELELTHRKDAYVSTLSGGEQKRVNVGVELLTRPSLLFLDEPTSGLDPGLERKFIRLVKRLTGEGRTIIMVTHATASIAECDKLLFMARGGRVAFYGPPQEALTFFNVADFAEAYLKVNDDALPPDYWEKRYRASEYYTRHVVQPQAKAPKHQQGQSVVVAQRMGITKPKVSEKDQFSILCRRYLDVLRGDTRNLKFLLAQAPIIGLLLMLVFPSDSIAAGKGSLLLFCMVISALLFGIINASREITKESAIYRRERLINLKTLPYLASKAAILSGLCLIQSTLLLLMVRLKIDFQVDLGGMAAIFLTLLMATLCGMLLGLCLSAVATTSDQAMSLVPVAILPQIIFSGLIDIEGLKPLRYLMPSYWAYGVMGHLVNLNEKIPIKRELFDITLPAAWFALIFLGALYAALAYYALKRQESASV
jgi:ABC-type multidrug transport system ATPase subunit/pSer/pThr/pTyr-binding forkhead associated (FHA) protein